MKKVIVLMMSICLSVPALAGSQKLKASDSEFIKSLAHVNSVQVVNDSQKWVKIISYSGGDPAMNGAYVTLAVYSDDLRDFNTFELANVADFKVLPSKKTGYLKIALVTDVIDSEGVIKRVKSTLFINLLNSDKIDGQIEMNEIK